MRDLRAMIALDLHTLRSLGWTAVILIGFALVLALSGAGSAAGASMIAVLCLTVGIQFFRQDEVARLNELYAGLPVSRRTVIRSHYLVCASAFVLGGACLTLLALAVRGPEDASAALGTCVVTAWITGAYIPVVVWLGKRAFLVLFLVVGVVGATLGFALGALSDDAAPRIVAAFTWLAEHPWETAAGVVTVLVVTWLVSYACTARIYARQDH
ncbi:ABC-2 transporter permease [uncultured Tessaracoccus sp.]|uniref:ABC-2 transporter permease n=1 Tax=uncultured Tessaracoccus sp. TaxID=905023 RepID=UPI0025F6EBC9|nr:ABC-2 transporter permease [uncultured Tessaracoccus sp.]